MLGPMPLSLVSVAMDLLTSDAAEASGIAIVAVLQGHSENAFLEVDMMSSAELEVASLRRLGRKVPCLLY